MKREKKQHMQRQVKKNIHHYIYENKVQCMPINGLKTGVQEANVTKKKEKYI